MYICTGIPVQELEAQRGGLFLGEYGNTQDKNKHGHATMRCVPRIWDDMHLLCILIMRWMFFISYPYEHVDPIPLVLSYTIVLE